MAGRKHHLKGLSGLSAEELMSKLESRGLHPGLWFFLRRLHQAAAGADGMDKSELIDSLREDGSPKKIIRQMEIWNCPATRKQIAKEYKEKAWSVIAAQVLDGCKRHDGTFFRYLADAIDRWQDPASPRLYQIARCFWLFNIYCERPPTRRELIDHLKRHGLPAYRQDVDRDFRKYLSLKCSKGKLGRPRKT